MGQLHIDFLPNGEFVTIATAQRFDPYVLLSPLPIKATSPEPQLLPQIDPTKLRYPTGHFEFYLPDNNRLRDWCLTIYAIGKIAINYDGLHKLMGEEVAGEVREIERQLPPSTPPEGTTQTRLDAQDAIDTLYASHPKRLTLDAPDLNEKAADERLRVLNNAKSANDQLLVVPRRLLILEST